MEAVRIRDREFGPVEKRSNCWGYFLTVDHCQPRFIAYGAVKTKRAAIEFRRRDIEAMKQ